MPSTDNNRLTASDMGPIEDSGTFEVGLRDDAHNVLPSIVNGSNSYWQPANQQNNSRVPFDPTKIQQRVQCEDGTSAQPLIEVTVEKGFFKADGDWTCYRRNYFSIDCSFRFEEDFLFPPYYIKRQDGSQSGLITLFHLAVTAISDSGRQIKLASHANTKRGSGPAPVTEGPLTFSKAIDPRSLFAEWTVSFQRMQFTLATANNGRRRASQQYFHLLVELFCETSGKHKPLILLALRKSAPIVVRGRSPGHYSEDISSMPIGASFPPSIPEIHSSSNLHMLSRPEITGMELVEEGYEPVTVATDTSDASSISSMQSSRSALSSKSSISSQEQNPQKFVDILLLDSGFKSLCIDGFRCIDADRFERNLRRLLRIFIKTLRAQLPSRLRSILRYYKFERAVNLARALRTLFANNDAEKRSMLQLKNAKVDKEKLFDQYLDDNIADYTEFDHLDTVEPSEQANGADSDVELFNTHFAGFPREAPNQSSRDYTKPGPLHALQQDVDSTSSDSDQSLAEDSYEALAPSLIPKLIFESDAWEELREGLMGLLVPILMSMYHEEHDRKRSECTLVHRTAYQDALPVTRSLIVDCKGACQILLEEPLLMLFILRQSAANLKAFSNSLDQIETGWRDNLLNYKSVNQEVMSLATDAITRIDAIQGIIVKLYTRGLQDRYQQSSAPKKACKKVVLPFRIDVGNAGLEYRNLHLDLEISSEQHNEASMDFLDIRALTKQLPTQSLEQLVRSTHPHPSLSGRISQFIEFPYLPLIYEACHSWGKYQLTRLHAAGKHARVGSLGQWWRELGRPSPPPGFKRMDWFCDCGEKLWGDFQIKDIDAVETVTRWSEHPNQGSSHNSTNRQPQELNANPALSSLGHLQARVSVPSQAANNVPIASAIASSTSSPLPRLPTERYLELCVNTGEYDISLAEIHITTSETSIISDGQLFEEIRRRYNKCRGALRSHKWSLFKPINVHFVRFCLEDGDVGILQSPLSLPTEDAVLHSRSWEFCPCPCPLKEPPPIPTNVFLHLFNSTRTHPRCTWLNRLPKKLHSSIFQRSGGPHVGWQAMGWGIHIIEGPNVKAIFVLHVILIIFSLTGAIAWAVLKGDVQGGFGIAGFVVAATGVLIWTGVGYGLGQQQERFVKM